MNEKQAVDAAKATRQPDSRTPRQPKQGAGRTTESAQTAGNTLQDKLIQGRKQLAKNIKTQLVAGAIADVVQDFERGDFGDLSEEMLDGLLG